MTKLPRNEPRFSVPLLRQIVVLAFIAAVCLAATPAAWAQKKSIMIGIDGLGYGEKGFEAVNTPRLDSLIDGSWATGYHGAYAKAYAGGVIGAASEQPTVSGPGWTTLVTGVWANKHNVYDNSFTSPDVADYPSYLATAKAADNSLTTASFLWWQIYNDTIFDPVNSDGDPNNNLDYQFVYSGDQHATGGDDDVANDAVEKLNGDGFNDVDADLSFVEFGDLDFAGHSCGSSGACYEAELLQTDLYVGQILDAITSRQSFASEDWQVIVSADHGHRAGGGHGGQSDLERNIPFIVSSQSLSQGILPPGVAQVDVAPTVLDHFGIAAPSYYDGVSQAAGGGCFAQGDFNADCSIDAEDWALLRDAQHTDFSGLTQQQAYAMGDLNGDLRNDHEDFVLFKTLFETANGPGSFQSMVASVSVPEPNTLALLLLSGLAVLWISRRIPTLQD